MTEMVTVGGIRYRKEDAARDKLVADSKAHQKLIAEGKAPTGVTEAIWKASQKEDAPARKAAGTKSVAAQPLNSGSTGAGAGDDTGDGAGAGDTGK